MDALGISRTFEVSGGVVDFRSPVLRVINITPSVVDVSSGPRENAFDLDITDESELFAKLVLEFEKPNGEFVDQRTIYNGNTRIVRRGRIKRKRYAEYAMLQRAHV